MNEIRRHAEVILDDLLGDPEFLDELAYETWEGVGDWDEGPYPHEVDREGWNAHLIATRHALAREIVAAIQDAGYEVS